MKNESANTTRVPTLGAVLSIFVMIAAIVVVAGESAVSAQGATRCGGRTATIIGTPGDDTLRGTNGVDVINALGGDDIVYGLGGNDIICGGHGDDQLYAGDGSDRVFGFNGADMIVGGRGADTLYGGRGADELHGNNGQDTLRGGPGFDELRGGAQRDSLQGGLHRDSLYGGAQLDECYSPNDELTGCERGGGTQRNTALSTVPLDEQYAAQMLRLINIERSKANLAPLSRNSDLDRYASDWTVVMSQQPLPLARERHHSPAFVSASTVSFRDLPTSRNWTIAFENVGRSEVGAGESVNDVMDRLFYSANGKGFMSSETHRCNILETAAREVGVGTYIDSSGDLWVAQVYWDTGSIPAPISACAETAAR